MIPGLILGPLVPASQAGFSLWLKTDSLGNSQTHNRRLATIEKVKLILKHQI